MYHAAFYTSKFKFVYIFYTTVGGEVSIVSFFRLCTRAVYNGLFVLKVVFVSHETKELGFSSFDVFIHRL